MNKKLVAAAKISCAALAGGAIAVIAAENVSTKKENDVPVLAAPSGSPAHSAPAVSSTTVSSSSSSSSISSASSSTTVSAASFSEPVEQPSSSETFSELPEELPETPPETPPEEPFEPPVITQSVPEESSEESLPEPPDEPEQSSSSSSPWGMTDEEWDRLLQNVAVVQDPSPIIVSPSVSSSSSRTSEASSSSSASKPSSSSAEPPVSVPDITAPAVVNINTASAEELELLNGVGPETALAIIEFRETFGGFTSIYEIREVSGIGDSVFERIRDFITI